MIDNGVAVTGTKCPVVVAGAQVATRQLAKEIQAGILKIIL
jgi:hypothetical protein